MLKLATTLLFPASPTRASDQPCQGGWVPVVSKRPATILSLDTPNAKVHLPQRPRIGLNLAFIKETL